jgi:hypothetical protein
MDPENGSPLDNPATSARWHVADEQQSAETLAIPKVSERANQNAA